MSVVKPKPITTNVNNKTNQSELEPNTRNRRQARENAYDQVGVGSASFSNQSQSVLSVLKQNQSNSAITFDTQMKTHLLIHNITVYANLESI